MITIRTDYPGGNIRLHRIVGDDVYLEQDIRDTTTWWFYWNFRVDGAEGRKLTFHFTNRGVGEPSGVVAPFGPGVSDDGIHWDFSKRIERISDMEFAYGFRTDEKVKYFSFALPYQLANFEIFWESTLKTSKWLIKRDVLCVSERGRDIPYVVLGNPHAKKVIVLSARNHACESNASYALEGTVNWLINEPNDFIDTHRIIYLPFADLDGVEDGDQGKNRFPHDHNRDYTDVPIYEYVRALYRLLDGEEIDIGIDYHCPWLWGGENDQFYIPRKAEVEQKQIVFSQVLADELKKHDGIQHDPKFDIPANLGWNLSSHPMCANYYVKAGAKFAVGLEFPYFGTFFRDYCPERLRELGANVGRALETYFATL